LKLQRLFNTTNAKVLVIDRLCTHYWDHGSYFTLGL
jgi:hypothetical protein